MKISVITPTEERAFFLKGLYELLKKQTYQEWEWLIYDTSLNPSSFSDARVKVFHGNQILSVGEKRNRLAEHATGEIIVHFDDDDYYSKEYLERVVKELNQHDFFKFHSFFTYQVPTHQFFYWDTDEECATQYHVDPISEIKVREIDFGPHLSKNREMLNVKGKRGYGFSFAYRKNVWKAVPFADLDFDEDRLFYDALEAKQFSMHGCADKTATVVHVIHMSNLSRVYPQYRIPRFIVDPLFPDFFSFAKRFYEN